MVRGRRTALEPLVTEVSAEYLTSTISEREFQTTVIEMAHAYGWLVHHTRPAGTATGWRTPIQGDAGFPDLVLARGGQVIIAELKRERGELTAAQGRWLAYLGPIQWPGFQACVWRPSDIDRIAGLLC